MALGNNGVTTLLYGKCHNTFSFRKTSSWKITLHLMYQARIEDDPPKLFWNFFMSWKIALTLLRIAVPEIGD